MDDKLDQATIEWQARAWRELCEYLDTGPMVNRRDKLRLFQTIDYYLPASERRKRPLERQAST